MNYAAMQALATKAITDNGAAVTFMRDGASVTKTYAVFVDSQTQNDTGTRSSLLAQTAESKKELMVAITAKSPQVGDTVVINRRTFTVTSVSDFTPANVPLYLTVGVA